MTRAFLSSPPPAAIVASMPFIDTWLPNIDAPRGALSPPPSPGFLTGGRSALRPPLLIGLIKGEAGEAVEAPPFASIILLGRRGCLICAPPLHHSAAVDR